MYSLVELVECSQEEPREPNYAQSPNLPHTPSLSTLLHFNLFSSISIHITSHCWLSGHRISRGKNASTSNKERAQRENYKTARQPLDTKIFCCGPFWYALDNGKLQVITLIEQNAKMKKKNRNDMSLGKLRCSKKGDQYLVQGSWAAWQWPETVFLANAFFILHQNR